jgi:hypothetical protein
MKNIFDTLLEIGHDEEFVPVVTEDFRPTDAPAGSPAKLEVLAERIRNGLPLCAVGRRVRHERPQALSVCVVKRCEE